MDGTVAHNVKAHGVGGLNIADCSIGRSENDKASGWSTTGSGAGENIAMSGANYARDPKPDSPGRWPANVVLDEEAAGALDAVVGDRPSTPFAASVATGIVLPFSTRPGGGYADSGGPSRFFYTAKASREERDLGCDALAVRSVKEAVGREEGSAGARNPRAGAGAGGGAKNHHPCVKPIALMRWLSRLMLPPERQGDARRIIIPYSGSGSEMIGALLAGWDDVIGIELEAEYIEIARHRLALAASNPRAFESLMDGELQRGEKIDPRQVSMWKEGRP
jgi:site-specific DNA-methyltransferase (adenine-specific)